MTAQSATTAAPRGAADRLVLAGRFAALAYLNFLVWLSVWVLVPMVALGWTPMAVESGSMGPVIRAGDVVMIAPYRGETLRPGKIVTFDDPAEPGRILTHRITGQSDDGTYQTKGDANQDADSTPLPAENIHGVGRLIVPRVGLPVIWLQQQRYPLLAGWMLSVLLAIGMLAPAKPATPGAPAPVPARGRKSRPATAAVRTRPARRPRRMAPLPLPAPPAVALPMPPAPAVAAPTAAPIPSAPAYAPLAPVTVPPVIYRVRMPRPPAPIDLPTPPRWTVSAVPPAPGTAPVAPIPPPPRPAAVRRGAALGARQVPGWSGRLHAILLVLALTAGLGLAGAVQAPPARAAFTSSHWSTVANTGNSFSASQLTPVSNVTTSAPALSCRIDLGWTHSTSAWRDGYRIYRAINADSNYSLLATIPASQGTYGDTTVTSSTITYYYRVVSYKAVTWESTSSEVHRAPTLTGCGV